MKWISATVNDEYSGWDDEGIDSLDEGTVVVLEENGTWYKI